MNKNIGILDSGIGGISVYREIKKILPKEKFIYLADKKNFPYGEKSEKQIKKILFDNIEWFVTKKVKLIVIACNTATVSGIDFLRQKYKELKFVGLEPAIKPAIKIAKKGVVILSSKLTAKSERFKKLLKKFENEKVIYNIYSSELIELIEQNKNNEQILSACENIFNQDILDKIDTVVLGCSHFPLVKKEMQEFLGKNIQIIDSGEAVAKQVKRVLEENKLLDQNEKCLSDEFYSSGEGFEFRGIKFETIRI